MNIRMIAQILGKVLCTIAVLLLLPAVVALLYGESPFPFLLAVVICAALGGGLILLKPTSTKIYAREGFVCVGLSWVGISLLGALPFVLNGDIPNYIDAVFETASGFTTTGASILTDVEVLSRSGLFWRSFTHWIGGMGVLVFIMAVLPMSGSRSMHIMRAEVPGPTVGKLVPSARKTAGILYLIYIILTLTEVIFLLFGGMDLYDALIHSFGTAGTGGFSNRAASIGYYNAYIQVVITVFMFLFGVNFNLYYLVLLGKVKEAVKSEELHWFIGISAVSIILITLNILPLYQHLGESLRLSAFQVGTIISTTGYATADFNQWPEFSKWILVMLMLCGSCAGSTCGGMKISRIVLLFKGIRQELWRQQHPHGVSVVRLEGKPVAEGTLHTTLVFAACYIGILVFGTLLLSLDGFDLTTNFTGTLACISNIGPGLSIVGPTGNYAMFSPLNKLLLAFIMLLGRLEIFPLLLLFSPSVWRKR